MKVVTSYNNPFLRAERYLFRVKSIYEGADCSFSSTDYFHDDIYAFFVFCFHVKDWLISDPKLGISKKAVEDYIKEHYQLLLCADVCNGTKHFIQTPSRVRTGKQPQVCQSETRISVYPWGCNFPSSGAIYKASFGVKTESDVVDVLSLAEDCILLWKKFMIAHNIEFRERDSYI